MKFLINGESLKELNELNRVFAASIPTRLNAAGVMLDDVLWVTDTLLERHNYHAFCSKKMHSVIYYARFNKVSDVVERLNKVTPALDSLWKDYVRGYNSIVARGVRCKTQGAWDVFKNLRKKLKSGKPFAFTAGGVRIHSEEKDTLCITYGDDLTKTLKTLVFDKIGDRFYIRCDGGFGEYKKRGVELNTDAGRVEYTKNSMFQDILNLVQSPVWETEDLPTHLCFLMCPTAFITSVLHLPLESTPDELGANELFYLLKAARRLAYGNA